MSVVYIFDFGKLLRKKLLKGKVKEKKKKKGYVYIKIMGMYI